MTDCARISLEFATAEGLERAAKFVLKAASTFKNRVANPTDEGYRDLMFTVLIGGHVCEVFAAPPPRLLPCRPAAHNRFAWGGGLACSPAQRLRACFCAGWASGEGRVVGVGRAGSVWWQGIAGSPHRSHEVPRALPRQVQLHLVEMIKAKKLSLIHI